MKTFIHYGVFVQNLTFYYLDFNLIIITMYKIINWHKINVFLYRENLLISQMNCVIRWPGFVDCAERLTRESPGGRNLGCCLSVTQLWYNIQIFGSLQYRWSQKLEVFGGRVETFSLIDTELWPWHSRNVQPRRPSPIF